MNAIASSKKLANEELYRDRLLRDQTDLTIIQTTRTEDKALQRCNLSAVPGAKTEGGRSSTAHLPFISQIQPSDLAQREKPSWHDATTTSTRCHKPFLAIPITNIFQLPLNQHTPYSSLPATLASPTCNSQLRTPNKTGTGTLAEQFLLRFPV